MMAGLPHLLGWCEILSKKELDEEWIKLIQEAINIGISVEDIKKFLKARSAIVYTETIKNIHIIIDVYNKEQ